MFALGLLTVLYNAPICPAVVATKATNKTPTENEVKAAYVYNFAKFVSWPSQAFSSPNDPIKIGVFGDNEFESLLESIVKDKTVQEHPIKVCHIKLPADFSSPHILYIGASELKRFKQIAEELRNLPVLTITEADTSFPSKGIMNLFVENGKVQFDVDIAKAERAHLQISSKLLRLARGTTGNPAAREE
jgi:hypothetical protein